jgi:hypothetical protein
VFLARCDESVWPTALVGLDGVRTVTPHTTKPLEESLTWNLAELWRVIRCMTKFVAFTETKAGAAALPLLDASESETSHHDWVCPTSTSPPCPSMVPFPTIPGPDPDTVMKEPHAFAEPFSVQPEPNRVVLRDANSVVPASTQRRTPLTVSGPEMNALLAPLLVSLTACPGAQALRAA